MTSRRSFAGTALRVVTYLDKKAARPSLCFAGTALRAATYPDFEVKDVLYCFVVTAFRVVTCRRASPVALMLRFAGTALRVVTHLLLLLMTLILCFEGTELLSRYIPQALSSQGQIVLRRYRVSGSYLPLVVLAVVEEELRRYRASSVNLLGYSTGDTAIVLHKSCTSSGYSLFRVSLAKPIAWFVKPLERTAPVIISNNLVELYGLGLNYETCPRAIAL